MRKYIVIILSLVLVSCSTVQKASDGSSLLSDLIGNEWILKSLNGEDVNEADFMKGLPTLTFKEDGAMQGSTGCNSFSGKFSLGEVMKLDPGAMTKMHCPGSGETDFINALTSATSIDVVKNDLVLKKASDELLRFTTAKE
ncbi:META domain-containing protein [Cryomorphaceae bacterium 1068]|nr:META domain-containing protein [Cryomorphaceae bacterium 1068]